MTIAADKIRGKNPNALIAYENDLTIGIEHHSDPDGRLYTLEYASTHDGEHAVSFCRYSPWGLRNSYWDGHVHHEDGLICTGPKIHSLGTTNPNSYNAVKASPYTIEWIVERSQYWTALYSYYRETGNFPS